MICRATSQTRALLCGALAVTLVAAPALVWGFGETTGLTPQQWDNYLSLIEEGRNDEAAEYGIRIITSYDEADMVLRSGYNMTVYAWMKAGDSGQVDRWAREALSRYPDLEVDIDYIPEYINHTYNDLRRRMFGSLHVAAVPGAEVFLVQDDDKRYLGEAPIQLELVPAGAYELVVSQEGYKEHISSIVVEPGILNTPAVPMIKEAGLRTWHYVVGGVVLVAAGYLVTDAMGLWDNTEALPMPPDPPSKLSRPGTTP